MKSIHLPALMLAGSVVLTGCNAPGHHLGSNVRHDVAAAPTKAAFKKTYQHCFHRHDMDQQEFAGSFGLDESALKMKPKAERVDIW